MSLDAIGWGFAISIALMIFAAGIVTGCALAASYELRREAERAARQWGRVGGHPHVVVVDPRGLTDDPVAELA